MLSNPQLANCNNRSSLPKTNPKYGEPTDWFSNRIINQYGYSGLSFDFFVDWNDISLTTNIVWYKLITKKAGFKVSTISDEIIKFVGEDCLRNYLKFLVKHRLILRFLIIPDDQDFSDDKSIVGFVEYDSALQPDIRIVDLAGLKDEIKTKSGGVVNIGDKGLIYGTSCLECALSKTDSLYPGDMDLILFENETSLPVGILEFKKHNLSTSLTEQKLSNYYPHPDKRKYDRLNIFRNKFFPDVPIIVLYYSTDPAYDYVVAEHIGEADHVLKSIKRGRLPFDMLFNGNAVRALSKW